MATEADFARMGNWAVMLNPDQNIDRHGSERVVPMQVLALGFSRTGTFSMHEALTILGYPEPYHFSSIFANVKDADMWLEAFAAKNSSKKASNGASAPTDFNWRSHFDALLGHCGAVTDAPCVTFWRELVAVYPEAKVVLVERDEDSWVKSICALLDGSLDPIGVYVFRFADPRWFGRVVNVTLAWIGEMFGSANPKEAKRNARESYRAHYEAIRSTVPPERRLDYRLGTGWKPLCDFLGKDVPDVEFPHKNEAKTLQEAIKYVLARGLKNSAINLAIVAGAGGVMYAVANSWFR